jgi:serine/threonine-protein kinase
MVYREGDWEQTQRALQQQAWHSAMPLFERWLDADEAQRTTLLAQLAIDDPPAHARLLKLIAADRAAEGARFLEADALSDIVPEEDQVTLRDLGGMQIGAWRLERLLGVGGTGQVWLARRCDGLHDGKAAVKLLRASAIDVHAQQRFAREGRLLARLEHPHIARLLDVGQSGLRDRTQGQRYLVLEYVDGERIDRWCDRHNASIDSRLQLFLQVCDAVAYAHANLIVHRDLKPSNILVQADGDAKLLDFGVAKLLEVEGTVGELREATELTRAAGAAFTPEYAAPEQFEHHPVTVTTDVYSLGVVLYVLLAGRRPYGEEHSTPAQLARASLEGEPRRLSLATGEKTQNCVRIAQSRGTTPEQLRRILQGDLDTIIARALKKNPAERYASMQAFADDVRRYLAHRPIRARADSALYRTRKFVRRHRVGVSVGILFVLAVLAGVVGIAWEAREAMRQADRAERSKAFLAGLITDANPFSLNRGAQANSVGVLDNALKRIERDFADAPDIQTELRQNIESVLFRISEYARARDLGRINIEALRRLHGNTGPQLGVALSDYGMASSNLGDVAAAHAAFAEAEPLLANAGPTWARDRISLMTGIAKLDNQEGNYAGGHGVHEAILRERRAMEGEESPDVAMDLMNLAADDLDIEQYAESAMLAQQAHAMLIKLLGPDHPRRIYVDNMLGVAQIEQGQFNEAVATLKVVVDMARAALGPDAVMHGVAIANLGNAQFRSGDAANGLRSLREARRIMLLTKYPARGRAMLKLGLVELATNQPEAVQTLRDTRDLLTSTPAGAGGSGYLELTRAAYGAALARSGQRAEGEAEARSARAELLSGKYSGSIRLGDIDCLIADIEDQHGAAADARELREEALATYQRVLGPDNLRTQALAAQLHVAANVPP